MPKHKATRPPTNWKWWRVYVIRAATLLVIKALPLTRQQRSNTTSNKTKN